MGCSTFKRESHRQRRAPRFRTSRDSAAAWPFSSSARNGRTVSIGAGGLLRAPRWSTFAAGAMSTISPGKLRDGKYEIVGLRGAGGMGEVYKARHVHLNTFRCIKVMRPALLADDSYRTRFLREARLATQIQHPNIAVVHDFELLDDGASYMVTEFIDGTTLRQWSS